MFTSAAHVPNSQMALSSPKAKGLNLSFIAISWKYRNVLRVSNVGRTTQMRLLDTYLITSARINRLIFFRPKKRHISGIIVRLYCLRLLQPLKGDGFQSGSLRISVHVICGYAVSFVASINKLHIAANETVTLRSTKIILIPNRAIPTSQTSHQSHPIPNRATNGMTSQFSHILSSLLAPVLEAQPC